MKVITALLISLLAVSGTVSNRPLSDYNQRGILFERFVDATGSLMGGVEHHPDTVTVSVGSEEGTCVYGSDYASCSLTPHAQGHRLWVVLGGKPYAVEVHLRKPLFRGETVLQTEPTDKTDVLYLVPLSALNGTPFRYRTDPAQPGIIFVPYWLDKKQTKTAERAYRVY